MRRTPHNFILSLVLILSWTLGCERVQTVDEPGGLAIYDAGAGGAPDGAIRPNKPVLTGEIAPVYGFVGPEEKVEYYYLGEVDLADGANVAVNAIYFFYDEDQKPLFRLSDDGTQLVGWHPVINAIPTRQGYSPFWRVHRVRVKGKSPSAEIDTLAQVPTLAETCQMDATCGESLRCIEDRCREPINVGIFPLDGIKSLETLDKSKLVVTPTDLVINCPIVDADAKLLKGLADPDRALPKVQLWFQRLRAFCYLMEGSLELLGAGAPSSSEPASPPAFANAFFIKQELQFDTDDSQFVLPARHLVLTEALPGKPGYSPLVREVSIVVGKDHEFKDMRSVAEAKTKAVRIDSTTRLHNLVVRGTLPSCTTDEDCANTGGKVDPPLKCSLEQGYCSPPFARFGEECRRGVKECDPYAGPNRSALVCVGLRVREKYFCFNACDSTKKDENPDPDIDSRCGAKDLNRCYALRQTDPSRPNGVCIQKCNSRAGDKAALIAQCVSPTCGNGKLEYGETCDDGNTTNSDGCNEFCSLSTFDLCDGTSDCRSAGQACTEPVPGQGMTYCLPVQQKEKDERADQDKYRITCMEYDYCWPPDERADWLGKKDETPGVQP
jgi:cysteine-rich repeat protein